MMNFTLDELSEFSKNEDKWVYDLLNHQDMVESKEITMGPRKETLDKILAFSKAFSLRRSKRFDDFALVLN